MKHSHEAATTREPIEASGRSCEVEQRDELADELNLMADGRCLMAKVEACGDHRTAASLRQDLSAMAQRRADRAAAAPKARQRLRRVAEFYKVDPDILYGPADDPSGCGNAPGSNSGRG